MEFLGASSSPSPTGKDHPFPARHDPDHLARSPPLSIRSDEHVAGRAVPVRPAPGIASDTFLPVACVPRYAISHPAGSSLRAALPGLRPANSPTGRGRHLCHGRSRTRSAPGKRPHYNGTARRRPPVTWHTTGQEVRC